MTGKDWGIFALRRFQAFLRMVEKLHKFCRLLFAGNFLFKCCRAVYGKSAMSENILGEKTVKEKSSSHAVILDYLENFPKLKNLLKKFSGFLYEDRSLCRLSGSSFFFSYVSMILIPKRSFIVAIKLC